MSTKRPVRLVKKEEPRDPAAEGDVESDPDPNKWSKAVRGWVGEFQQQQREESLPAFDSLFKDALP